MPSDTIKPEDRVAIKIVMVINSFNLKEDDEFSFHAIKDETGKIYLPNKIIKKNESVSDCIDEILSEYLIVEQHSAVDCNLVDVIDTFSKTQNERIVNLVFKIAVSRTDNHYFNKSLSMFKNKEILDVIEQKENISVSDAAAILMTIMGASRQVSNV